MRKKGISVTVSGGLISHVRQLYDAALKYLASGHGVRQGINGYIDDAPPAYIITVAAVEAFLNENFLSDLPRLIFKDSALWTIPSDSLDRMELGMKLVLIPQFLFSKSFSRGSQPYQDMALLIKVRNDFVHYKMKGTPPEYLKALDDRGISLVARSKVEGVDYAWPWKLSSSEGIRWAHNTACKIIDKLVSFMPADKAKAMAEHSAKNFTPISDSHVREWFIKRGIDPDSDDPAQK